MRWLKWNGILYGMLNLSADVYQRRDYMQFHQETGHYQGLAVQSTLVELLASCMFECSCIGWITVEEHLTCNAHEDVRV